MLQLSIGKDQLAQLEVETYRGKIVLIDSYDKFEKIFPQIEHLPVVGIDTESRPVFRKGASSKVSLVQISSVDCCYLLRINKIGGLPRRLIRFFENGKIKKIGLSLRDDLSRLREMVNFNESGFIDLQQFIKGYCIRDNGLDRIYAIVFNKRISKGERLTNWETPELTPDQIRYAALDAWSCLHIYNYLSAGKFNPLSSKYVYIEPSPIEET